MRHFIIVSQPGPLDGEAAYINTLFEAGMPLLHLRKPRYELSGLEALLQQIDPLWYNRIVLHSHHQLAAHYAIKRLHFPGALRLAQSGKAIARLEAEGYTLSTSIHDTRDYELLAEVWAYAFIGPFAASISKPGYGQAQHLNDIRGLAKKNIACIAIGGLQAINMHEPLAAGFDGIALLGSIWQQEKTVDNFKHLYHLWHTTDPQY